MLQRALLPLAAAAVALHAVVPAAALVCVQQHLSEYFEQHVVGLVRHAVEGHAVMRPMLASSSLYLLCDIE